MGFVAQWRSIAGTLPDGWSECRLRLTPARAADADRAARLLGPASPGRASGALVVHVYPGESAAIERLLARLDSSGIAGSVELAGAAASAPPPAVEDATAPASLADAWDGLARALPDDWTDLLCLVELRSSDDLAPAALALAPVNPLRHGTDLAFRFRVAHRFGYGAAPEMARRCLARVDDLGISGTLRMLEAFSDTRPHLTQGPTFKVGGRAV